MDFKASSTTQVTGEEREREREREGERERERGREREREGEMVHSGSFLREKPAATESRYPTYGACWVF